MNTREHTAMKMRGNPDISYLGHTVDQMIWSFMEQEKIDGLTLAIVQAPYIPRVAGYGYSDSQRRRHRKHSRRPAPGFPQHHVARRPYLPGLCGSGRYAAS